MAGTCNWVKIGFFSSCFILSVAFSEPTHVDYVSPMGAEDWRASINPLRCGLSLVIPNYGVGYFEQFAKKEPHFILRTWEQVQRTLPALILATPPVWKPVGRNFMVAKAFIKPGEYGVFLARDQTIKLLVFLAQGYQANFNYRSEQGFTTTVTLSPVHFQKVYAQYKQCLGALLTFDYEDVKESIFHFATDSRVLTEEDKAQLKRIVQYVAADGQVQVVRVVGYADDSGRKGYNNAISQFRAETIKHYLLAHGLPKNKLYVTWLGAQQPVARNDTEDGRAANRRVVVTVLKK